MFLRLKIKGLPVLRQDAVIQKVQVCLPQLNVKARIILPFEMPIGTIVEGLFSVSEYKQRLSPGMYNQKPFIIVRPKRVKLYFPDIVSMRWRLYEGIKENFSRDVADLFLAITIGKQAEGQLYRDYSRAGLAHLLAISGTHFGFLALLTVVVVKSIMNLIPYSWLLKISRRVSLQNITATVVVIVLSFYLFLSGFRVPTLRAYIMFLFFSLGLIFSKQRQWLYILAVSAVIVSFIDPEAITGPSFLLSYTAVFLIALSWQTLSKYLPKIKNRIKKTLIVYCGTTFVAFVGTLPLVVFFFNGISLVSPLMNLIIVPFITLLLLPLLFLWSIVYLLTNRVVFVNILDTLGRVFQKMVHYVGSFSFSYISVPHISVLSLILIYVFFIFGLTKRYRLALLCFFLFVVITFLNKPICKKPMVTFLDTAQAESSVIETGDGGVIVIDTAKTGIETSAYLRYRAIDKIELLLITHSALDHAGGMARLLREFSVDTLLLPYLDRAEGVPESVKLDYIKAGDRFSVGDQLKLVVLNPPLGYLPRNENNASAVIKAELGDFSVLFTADIEAEAERMLLKYQSLLKANVLKVAHHGSRTSSTEAFLLAVSPQVAIISVGKANPYGHPHNLILQRLRSVPLLRTDRDGAIRICAKDDMLRIYRWKDFMLKSALGSPEEEINNFWRLLQRW